MRPRSVGGSQILRVGGQKWRISEASKFNRSVNAQNRRLKKYSNAHNTRIAGFLHLVVPLISWCQPDVITEFPRQPHQLPLAAKTRNKRLRLLRTQCRNSTRRGATVSHLTASQGMNPGLLTTEPRHPGATPDRLGFKTRFAEH